MKRTFSEGEVEKEKLDRLALLLDAELAENMDPRSAFMKEMKELAASYEQWEIRILVKKYYQLQNARIRANLQVKSAQRRGLNSKVLPWFLDTTERLEGQVKKLLDAYSINHPIGIWMRAIDGVGPVISAGLLAHFDINKAPTAGHFWSFAGLNPMAEWKKGELCPWNQDLKHLGFNIGECFVKVSNKETSLYGHIYKKHKEREKAMNDAGQFASTAAQQLQYFKDPRTVSHKAYKEGKLPDGHLHARAKIKAVSMFIGHLHEVWYRYEFGKPPRIPYVFEHGGESHVHYVAPPGEQPVKEGNDPALTNAPFSGDVWQPLRKQ